MSAMSTAAGPSSTACTRFDATELPRTHRWTDVGGGREREAPWDGR